MAKKLNFQSSFQDIGMSLSDTLEEIKLHGETKQLKFDMLLKYGRLLLANGDPDKAYKVFQQCSIHAIDNGMLDVRELYFWTCRVLEEQGKNDKAISIYMDLLERDIYIKDDEDFVNAILERLITYGDISSLASQVKNRTNEYVANPNVFLGKITEIIHESNKKQQNIE